MRWNVGALLSEREARHVELVRHVDDEAEVAIGWSLVSVACEAVRLECTDEVDYSVGLVYSFKDRISDR